MNQIKHYVKYDIQYSFPSYLYSINLPYFDLKLITDNILSLNNLKVKFHLDEIIFILKKLYENDDVNNINCFLFDYINIKLFSIIIENNNPKKYYCFICCLRNLQ